MDLFSLKMESDLKKKAPLAQRMRPRNLDEFIGQSHLMGSGKYFHRLMDSDFLPSLLFYGPPGIGKTSLAEILAKESKRRFTRLSAVTSNVKELREELDLAEESLKINSQQTVLFLDEIHRFNKGQQDVLLPFIEKGQIILMGATTENPYFYVNKALLSRLQVIELKALTERDLYFMIDLALKDKERGFGGKNIQMDEEVKDLLVDLSNGDARSLYNSLENLVLSTNPREDGALFINLEDAKASLMVNNLRYDRDGNIHYDSISAFIKSIRGSDPDAAIFYLAKMLESGEKPEYVARRLIISASEDISNADPHALPLAMAAFEAARVIGMPEAGIPLAQVTAYLASAPKSNAAYQAINKAIADVKKGKGKIIPAYLRDKHQPMDEKDQDYKYPHAYPNAYVAQRYLPEDMEDTTYYEPRPRGYEKKIKEYLDSIKED